MKRETIPKLNIVYYTVCAWGGGGFTNEEGDYTYANYTILCVRVCVLGGGGCTNKQGYYIYTNYTILYQVY